MGNCCKRERSKRKIVLLLVGLDNAGKTRAANGLIGEKATPVPTVGFSVLNLKYLNHAVKIFDLGGGPSIRGIWNKYFVDAHGLIFVIDSSDISRFEEVKTVLEDIIFSDKVSGKPILILANKQDNENSVDEIEIIEYLNLEQLVNLRKCPTLVQSCSASEETSKLDLGIQKGYNWIMGYIIKHYDILNERVQKDVNEQEIKEKEELLEKIQRIKQQHALEEIKQKDDTIETYSEYVKKINGEAKLILNSVEEKRSFDELTNPSSSSSRSSSNNKSVRKTESIESFPPVYVSNEFTHIDRPRSAVELIKNQLKMRDNVQKPPPRGRSNKTAPIHLYGARFPRSADDKRRELIRDDRNLERRNLRSADNALFTISRRVGDNIVGPSGDFTIGLKIFENGGPPNFKTCLHRQNSGGDVLSVIDI